VINLQDGHILCDPNPATCGFSLRIQWSTRIVKSRTSSPKEILVAFIKSDHSWRVLHRTRNAGSLAEKPKMGKLQMDWLRSEDLKEEKNVTAPVVIIAAR
jgi:hypothetical protein